MSDLIAEHFASQLVAAGVDAYKRKNAYWGDSAPIADGIRYGKMLGRVEGLTVALSIAKNRHPGDDVDDIAAAATAYVESLFDHAGLRSDEIVGWCATHLAEFRAIAGLPSRPEQMDRYHARSDLHHYAGIQLPQNGDAAA